jgi:Zn finger protein HypA/HybF involved in hydrogenase expression
MALTTLEQKLLEKLMKKRDAIRKCQQCEAEFSPMKRQIYCSSACSQKARTIKYLTKRLGE